MLTTTTVGSFPKPDYLIKARAAYCAGKISDGDLMEYVKKAVRETIELQERIGLDILVHGEMERGDMVSYFAGKLDGFKASGPVRSYGNRYYHKPIVKGPIRRHHPMTVEMYKFARSLTKKPVKGILTGPYTMSEWSFNVHYTDKRSLVMDLAEIISEEAGDLQNAGAEYIQIDEPAISMRPIDIDLAKEAMAVITSNLQAKTICHICYGDFTNIFPAMNDLPVDQLDLEFANSDFNNLEMFYDLEFPKEIAIGVIDSHSHRIETVTQIKNWIMSALEVFSPEKIYIDPDCGLKTRTLEETEAKLTAMVNAVHEIKADMGWK